MLLNGSYDSLGREEILEMSHRLSASVDNTIKMADNLITWAKIQMNDVSYNPKMFKIRGVLTSIYNVYKNVAEDKNISLSISSDEGLSAYGDRNQINFIIRNLVNNALKFTHSGGSVDVSAYALPNQQIEISVRDNGMGMTEEMKQNLFALGSKTSNVGTAGETGTGLGLMLCYEFINVNGGEIRVESEEKAGTTFFVTFQGEKELEKIGAGGADSELGK